MPAEAHAPLIQLTDVRKAYPEGDGERVIFEHLEASIAAGELTVLLGRSGSGKSTLLNLISGIDLPDRGTVAIDGSALTELSERERTLYRRRHIGFVFRFFNLVSTLTVEENLLLPLELNGTRESRAQLSGSPFRRRAATGSHRAGAGARPAPDPGR